MTKTISLIVSSLMLLSCTAATPHLSAHEILPRKGYVFIKKTVLLKKTTKEKIERGQMTSVGSGFVIKITHKGAFIMTAAHVCVTKQDDLLPNVEAQDVLKVETLDGRWFNTRVIKANHTIDACIVFAEDLVTDIEEVKTADEAPKEGDKVYNIASPYGIHYNNVVPIFEGRYFGSTAFKSFYSFEAAPGSSGSMILNSDGELIGLLHSVYRDMYSIAVGVKYDALIQFIKNSLIEHSTEHMKEMRDYNQFTLHKY